MEVETRCSRVFTQLNRSQPHLAVWPLDDMGSIILLSAPPHLPRSCLAPQLPSVCSVLRQHLCKEGRVAE